MSWFLHVLRCILCFEEPERQRYEPDIRVPSSNPPQPTYFRSTTTAPSVPRFSNGSTSSSRPLLQDHRENQRDLHLLAAYEKLLERERTSRLSQTSNNLGSSLSKTPQNQVSLVAPNLPTPLKLSSSSPIERERTDRVSRTSNYLGSSLSKATQNQIPQKPPPPKPLLVAPNLPTPLKLSSSSPKPPPSSPTLSPIPNTPTPSSKRPPASSKLTLSRLPSDQPSQSNYVWVQKGTSSVYAIPQDIKDLINKDIVPRVLNYPVSPSTYADYFAALLYAEDFYIEKWSEFELKNVTLDLEEATIYDKSAKNKWLNKTSKKEEKTFVVLTIDSVREERPFLLSRDFVFVRPSGTQVEPFQGTVHRVVKSTKVLVEFGRDFHSQHRSTRRYDVSFSFNRVCLTRAHKAVEAASNPFFKSITFPRHTSTVDLTSLPAINEQKLAICDILSLKAPTLCLVKGPLCITQEQLSKTGSTVSRAVLEIYRSCPESRTLICAPTNRTCDLLMRSLKAGIPESDMFRANAAFREIDGVPVDILPSCVYKRECFACPSLEGLAKMRVISATFVSSFRLCNEGIVAGHFSHVFLLDASEATEPEAMIALANLADEKTKVVVTGAPGNAPRWVRSDIARANGLKRSYFERLCRGAAFIP